MNFVALLLSWTLLPGFAGAHKQPESPPNRVHVHSRKTALRLNGLIRLDVTVTDAAGGPVSGLTRGDFAVLDNGQPRHILAFAPGSAQSDSKASVILLVDTLDLAPQLAALERQQVALFLRRDGGNLKNLVTLCTLTNRGFSFVAHPSTNGNALASALDHGKGMGILLGSHVPAAAMNLPGTRTINPYANAELARGMKGALGQSLYNPDYTKFPPLSGVQALAIIAAKEDHVPERKLLLWIGPAHSRGGTGAYPSQPYLPLATREHKEHRSYTVRGFNTQQQLFDAVFWLSTLLRQARVTVDVFSVGGQERAAAAATDEPAWRNYVGGATSASQANMMDLYKDVLAVQSGGRVLPPGNGIAAQIEQEVRQASDFYSLTFDPPLAEHANEYHRIAIRLARTGLAAHTTTGYYDEPFYDDPPNAKVRPVTVAALERMIHSDPRHAARAFPDLRLTQRLSFARLESLFGALHSNKAREALLALTDQADFLPPPDSEVLAGPPPSAAQQKQMLAATADFLSHRLPQLPNFFADRRALFLSETPGFHELDTNVRAVPLHIVRESNATIVYRHGGEMLEADHARGEAGKPQALQAYGSFGPVLKLIRNAVGSPDDVSWSHWERGATGRAAVFAFRLPSSLSRFAVQGCCLAGLGSPRYLTFPATHGDFAIDPASGAILRIKVIADLRHFVPVDRSEVGIDYGRVTIGGKSYIVPMHSVTLFRSRAMVRLKEWNQSFRTWGPYSSLIDDFIFDRYHMFRPTIQLLPSYTPGKARRRHR